MTLLIARVNGELVDADALLGAIFEVAAEQLPDVGRVDPVSAAGMGAVVGARLGLDEPMLAAALIGYFEREAAVATDQVAEQVERVVRKMADDVLERARVA